MQYKKGSRLVGAGWSGDFWYPQGASDETIEKAREYGNEIVDDKIVRGTVISAEGVFGSDKPRFALSPVLILEGNELTEVDGYALLLPSHTGLNVLSKVVDSAVEIQYLGAQKIKSGPFRGKDAHRYDVFLLGEGSIAVPPSIDDTPF